MSLYIQVIDGRPINHPAFEGNLREAFGEIPNNWEPFVRIDKPTANLYKVVSEEPSYEKIDGVWTDIWSIRDMTDDEKVAAQKPIKDAWAARPQAENWSAWTFDDANCQYVPPIPRPEPDQSKIDAGIFTGWCGADNNWKDTPPRLQDGKQYKFDFLAWNWVEVTSNP